MSGWTARVVGAAIVVLGSLTSGCSAMRASEDPAGAKAGADAAPLTLTAGDSQPLGQPSNEVLRFFADRVAELSDGAMRVSVVADASTGGPTQDAPVIAALVDGDLDIATIPARAWAAAGVTSLVPLQAAFEFTSERHMVDVAHDEALTHTLLDPLVEQGVHPLELFPEALRFLFSFGDPMTAPDALRGATIWSVTPGLAEQLSALGADVIAPADADVARMRRAGDLDAAETDLVRATTNDIFAGAVTAADVPIMAKFQTIAVNAATWDRLTTGQQAVLEDAAAAAHAHADSLVPSTDEQAAAFCARGGAVVRAGADRLEAFRSALASSTAQLDTTVMAAIRADGTGQSPPTPTTCDGRVEAPDVGDATAGFPDGVYRLQWDATFARAWNADHDEQEAIRFSAHDLAGLPAVITWTMSGGTYRFEIQFAGEPPFTVDGGHYSVDRDRLSIELLPEVGNVTNVVRFDVAGDGTVTFEQVDDLLLDPYYAVPWTRVGDADTGSDTTADVP